MSLKSFLISKAFFKSLAIAFVVVVIMMFVTIKGLGYYTDNGSFILVPKLAHRDSDSLRVLSSADYLQYEVIDSMYADDYMPGTVVLQNPTPGAKVKKGRKVYLSIVAKTPELVSMPNLLDLSIRRAIDVVQYAHLKVERIEFADDIALNAVIEQLYKGDTIAPDSLLPSGASITLVVGNGYRKTGATVPFVLGKNLTQARKAILKASFNMGRIDTLQEDYEGRWFVYEQSPFADPLHPSKAPLGSNISLKLRSSLDYNFDSIIEFYNSPDSVRYDSLMFQNELTDF
ncbi:MULTISPECIES: PASTA domain-containing protein [unclassified Lentimicrobium]|uniref:PASTA domain-containing protein n=1 Tax=unclassified Lentimicrobium TaxID=2677434 RepID=UPI001552F0B0|nr:MULTISPECIES: PASTA domain-containing protein [unclassified Lentimicrobium]NPD44685.1 PASTA domain-containing protein [Lentimicrobium sp. S6]NPD83459.1 PASTA domain-containing protein [Lentimicrobium sp. L6]